MLRFAVICAFVPAILLDVVFAGLLVLPKLNRRIAGGNNATIEQFPFQVSLRYYGHHRCAGSIYKPNVVVTAAHCVQNIAASQLLAVGGTTLWWGDGVQRNIRRIIPNKGFSPESFDFDVAILILDNPFHLSASIQTIDLAKSGDSVPDGSVGTVSGWGAEAKNEDLSENLKYIDVFVINTAECNKIYGGGMITSNMLCAGSPGKDVCHGDSDGPLVVAGKLVGIVSWGSDCALIDYPGVYSRVSSYRKWIDEQLLIFDVMFQ